jgi:hypothetical protein
MSAYAIPMYLGTSLTLCLSYCCIESTKQKGKLDGSDKSILSIWSIISIIVTIMIAGTSSGMTSMTFVSITMILAITTICISSCMVSCWS